MSKTLVTKSGKFSSFKFFEHAENNMSQIISKYIGTLTCQAQTLHVPKHLNPVKYSTMIRLQGYLKPEQKYGKGANIFYS